MNPLPFHILLALAGGDAAASVIKRRVEAEVGLTVVVRERGFYTALKRLVAEGAICRVVDNSGGGSSYWLTPLGRRCLQAEKIRLERAVRLLHERL